MYYISSKENVTRLTYVFLNAVFQLNSKTAYFRSQVCTKLFSFFFFFCGFYLKNSPLKLGQALQTHLYNFETVSKSLKSFIISALSLYLVFKASNLRPVVLRQNLQKAVGWRSRNCNSSSLRFPFIPFCSSLSCIYVAVRK